MNALLISRHNLLPAQREALQKLGVRVIRVVEHVGDPNVVVNEARDIGAEVIIVTALPLPLLINLLSAAKREGIKVWTIKMKPVGLAKTKAEMRKLIDENPTARVAIPSANEESWRIMEFNGIFELREIKIVEERIWP